MSSTGFHVKPAVDWVEASQRVKARKHVARGQSDESMPTIFQNLGKDTTLLSVFEFTVQVSSSKCSFVAFVVVNAWWIHWTSCLKIIAGEFSVPMLRLRIRHCIVAFFIKLKKFIPRIFLSVLLFYAFSSKCWLNFYYGFVQHLRLCRTTVQIKNISRKHVSNLLSQKIFGPFFLKCKIFLISSQVLCCIVCRWYSIRNRVSICLCHFSGVKACHQFVLRLELVFRIWMCDSRCAGTFAAFPRLNSVYTSDEKSKSQETFMAEVRFWRALWIAAISKISKKRYIHAFEFISWFSIMLARNFRTQKGAESISRDKA